MLPGITDIGGLGQDNTFVLTQSISTDNYVVEDAATAAGWNGTDQVYAILTASSLGSSASTDPAFSDGTLPAGSSIRLTVSSGQTLWGKGGNGGAGSATVGVAGTAGSAGGTAIYTRTPLTLYNMGTIAAGGGGGGGGGCGNEKDPKIGGYWSGGAGANGRSGNSTSGASSGGSAEGTGAGAGGNGGARGTAGTAGSNGTNSNGGALGAAGRAIDGVSYVTFAVSGTIVGTQVN